MANIVITASDRRNTSSSKSIPFIFYRKPHIELHKLDNAIQIDDQILILPPEATIQFKISSPIGLSKITYTINNNTQEINLNGEREYILSIKIPWESTPD
jgi:hypothetical protein